ncbi:TIGR03745 family integrating conjugative element membrane protein [Pectobacterium jejuense]|uniref:TIGR03745 family integrating conjugative element membrane protein n=1 Tax=Pectobacterium TaxID=122277 RepID=UPI0022825262|nr:TIGR03745 family integrating conjugative element membrane protein [Pectobacterium jejuense]MCY9848913.1 TIGR03745 family integrating conjugative element membrane protein [Pectobacterium jejuense]
MFMLRRLIAFLFYISVLCQSAFAALPGIEAPQSSAGSGMMGQLKGYLQDGITLGGLLVAAIMFINVAIAAGHTFTEVRNERASWTKFGAIVVVGALLLVLIIWLLGKSANIIL